MDERLERTEDPRLIELLVQRSKANEKRIQATTSLKQARLDVQMAAEEIARVETAMAEAGYVMARFVSACW